MKYIIHVKPNKKEQKIIKISEKEFEIWVKSSPIENRANIELIELLSKNFKVPKSKIKIVKGKSSRIKIVEINY